MSTPAAPEAERLTYTIPEAAKLLGLSKSTAYRAVESGDLPVIRVRGRLLVPRERLRQMLNDKEERMTEDNIDPKVAQALDERVDWIERAFGALREDGPTSLSPLIDEIPPEHLKSVVYVLMLQRANDYENVKEMLANLN